LCFVFPATSWRVGRDRPAITGWGTEKFVEAHLAVPALVAQLNAIGLRGGLIPARFQQEGAEPMFHPIPLTL